MPSARDGRFVEPRQVGIVAEDDLARIRARLAGDDIHHRRFAGAVGTDQRAHFARLDSQGQFVERPKPIEADADPVEVEQAVALRLIPSPRVRDPTVGSGSGPDRAGRARGTSSPISPRGRNSVTTMNRAPSANSHNSGSAPVNQVLPKLTSTAPSDRAKQRAAAADRDPDHRLDRIDRRELARIDDPDLRHIKRAARSRPSPPRGQRRTACTIRPVAEKPCARSRRRGRAISTWPKREAMTNRGKPDSQRRAAIAEHAEQRDPRRIRLDSKPRISLKSVRPLLPPNPMSLRKKASMSA